jgi:putative colanic acid biosynthesis UDP-glucose lipid carrier transferase
MNRIEKVLQNDDSAYIYFIKLIKTFIVFISFYLFSILEKNSIYELTDIEIFINSKYFLIAFFFSISYFIITIFFIQNKIFKHNFISFIKEDLVPIFISQILIFSIYFLLNKIFIINLEYLYLLIFLTINLFFTKKMFNYIYDYMINNDIIHKNIMLVGSYNDLVFFLKNKKEKINVFKCCIINDLSDLNKSIVRNEIKIPVFSQDEDIRSILEYHELGQIWVLESNPKNTEKLISSIIKFSVDILVVDVFNKPNILSKNLLYNKFEFRKYEISKFYGPNLLLKIFLDKFLSVIFITLASPILLISSLLIFLEDGFPILFTQDRTGWDGRRFRIYKLRTLNKKKFDKTTQVTNDDNRKLKCGSFIRKFSIDEIPQLFNVIFGDMSIVGPRPHMVEHDIKYSKLFMNYLKRHKCNPGLTGWAQVNGLRGSTSDEQMRKRMEYDLWYLDNWNIALDLYIIIKTFYAIFKFKGE